MDFVLFAGIVCLTILGVALYLLVFRMVPAWAAIPMTIVVAFACAALFRRVVLTQVARASGSPVNLVIATLGLSYVLKGLVRQTGFGDTPRWARAVPSRFEAADCA